MPPKASSQQQERRIGTLPPKCVGLDKVSKNCQLRSLELSTVFVLVVSGSMGTSHALASTTAMHC